MGTLTKGLIGVEDIQGQQGVFNRKTSTGGTQEITQLGLQSRIINVLDYISDFTSLDMTDNINAALLAASANDASGADKIAANTVGNAVGPLSTEQAWTYAGYVYFPAGTYWARNIKVPHGVRMVGAGRGGTGYIASEGATRLCQLDGTNADFVTFIDRAEGDVGYFEIAHMTIMGERASNLESGVGGSTAGSGINFYGPNDGGGAEVGVFGPSHIHDVNIVGFKEHGIQADSGIGGGLKISDVEIQYCGGYGMSLGAAINNTSNYTQFSTDNVRVKQCTQGGIYVRGLAATATGAYSHGMLVFNSTYFEMGPNEFHPDPNGYPNKSSSGDDNHNYDSTLGAAVMQEGFIFDDCEGTPVVINGCQHGAASTYRDGTNILDGAGANMTPHAWGPFTPISIKSTSRGTPLSPNITWNGVSLRRDTNQLQGRFGPGFNLVDTSRGWATSPWAKGSLALGDDVVSLTTTTAAVMSVTVNTLAALNQNGVLPTDPFACTAGSKTITVTHTTHPFTWLSAGGKACVSFPTVSDAPGVGTGYVLADFNNQARVATYVNANTYTVELETAALSTESFGGTVSFLGGNQNSVSVEDAVTLVGLDKVDGFDVNGTWRVAHMDSNTLVINTGLSNGAGGGAGGGGDMGDVYWTQDASILDNCVRFIDTDAHSGTYGSSDKVVHATDDPENRQVYSFGSPEYRAQWDDLTTPSAVAPVPDVFISGARPGITLFQPDAKLGKKHWSILTRDETLEITTADDDGVQATTAPLAVTHAGAVVANALRLGGTVTIAADAVTATVTGAFDIVTSANTTPTAITSLRGEANQVIVLRGGSSADASTVADSGNFNLSAPFTASLTNTLTLYTTDGTTWFELARSVNA